MRKHGWQLPYHPLQVVAVAVFLSLGFAFYVFFAPFVGRQLFQWIIMGIYTPLLICAFGLYIWCAGSDPADSGVFRSKKYINIAEDKKLVKPSDSKNGGGSTSLVKDTNGKEKTDTRSSAAGHTNSEPKRNSECFVGILGLLPCAYICKNSHEESSCKQSEDGMFYCSLCEVEVFKYSKHCRACDKCVDCFDHHCRWLNNCIGKRNYRKFFTLMVSSLLLLILQWSTGILVLTLCFLEKKKFSADITTKLGSSFTLVPFVIVVAVCTILAMVATLPLAQLFFFHILLIKKGISTYDYVIALREQEQLDNGGQQISPGSSVTGFSSVSSFNTFHRGTLCTPPQLFIEDQYDVVPLDNISVSSFGKNTITEEQVKKKNHSSVKISPWMLAHLNADDVSKAAAEARKKSKILRPVTRPDTDSPARETDSSSRRLSLKTDNRKRGSRRIRLPLSKLQGPGRDHTMTDASLGLGPLQFEARSDYRASWGILEPGPSSGIIASSPESSLDSLDIHPFQASSEDGREHFRVSAMATPTDIPFSTSDGYDASGGEDSDRVPTRIAHRSGNWSSAFFGSELERNVPDFMTPSSSTLSTRRLL